MASRRHGQKRTKVEKRYIFNYKNLILEHYTFMRRPILIYGKRIFIGNDKKNIDSLKKFLDGQI